MIRFPPRPSGEPPLPTLVMPPWSVSSVWVFRVFHRFLEWECWSTPMPVSDGPHLLSRSLERALERADSSDSLLPIMNVCSGWCASHQAGKSSAQVVDFVWRTATDIMRRPFVWAV